YEEMDPAWVVTTPVAVDGECVGVFYNDAAITGSPLDETEQDLLAVYCSILGRILERKAAEAALTESEARHRTLFESTRDAVMILDAEAFLDGNQATLDVFGCATREEFLGRHPGEVSPPKQPDGRDSRSVADERIATALREGSDHFEWLHCRVDGTEFPADVLLSRLDLGEGPMLQAVVRDITARKKAEEGTRQTSKLESIGALAGGVAHDFNNILTGIIGYADIMRDEGLVGSEGTQELATIRELADKAANLTRQLLAFSRQQPIETKILKPNELIHELTKLLGRVIGEDVRVQLNLAEGLHRISADAGQVQQVIMNLVVNARDAMPEGGTLTIETANVLLDEEYADSHVDVTPGGYVMLAISDSGHGMDAETQEHIFEPFFTTKEVGEGTGLGLATVYGIVKQHGGNIWVYSELGTGTTFKMYLPRATGEVDRTAPVASARADTARGEVVLLVEDDPTVRAIAQRTLVNQGYTVLVASNAGEAERVSTAHDDGITLLLSDVVMPGRTGPDLYESLAAQRPGLKVLFMSGYPKAAASNGVLRPDRPLLQKPFTPTSLAEKVREVLDGQDG
ncbi:MAG TPA: ATP-binding protein, partial [Armatimonadota bacterium]|nr:ATP-binding protein [Armatimonadota bacterium]